MGKRTLREMRFNRGFASQEDVAILLDVDPSTYGNWERGKTSPSVDYAKRICEIFNCTLNDIEW